MKSFFRIFAFTLCLSILFALMQPSAALAEEKPADKQPVPTKPEKADAPKAPAQKNLPTARREVQLEGWTIRVDERLYEPANEKLGKTALRFLEAKLFEISIVVPEPQLGKLRAVKIVLDLAHGKLGSMQYHPSAGWLKSNGYSEELAKCVHLPVAASVVTKRNISDMPWVILHELSHAYHDQVLGFDNARIKALYEAYKASGHGDKTMLYDGRKVKHYALTTPMEFFAEMTEAYFGCNDFYPFNHGELKEAEPEIYAMLTEIWKGKIVEKTSDK